MATNVSERDKARNELIDWCEDQRGKSLPTSNRHRERTRKKPMPIWNRSSGQTAR